MDIRLVRCAMIAALATSTWTASAVAQSASDKAAAEGLFDQGRSLMQEGDFGKACGLLERSQHIEPAIGTLLYLGECYEKSGRIASAWATFREAADVASAAKENQRARTGRERAQRLEPLLSRLTIQVAPETQQISGLTVDRKDKQVQAALFNVPVPTDPGEYTITASAPGYEPWSGTVTVPERAGRVAIDVPPLKKTSGEGASTAPPATPATTTVPQTGKPGDDTARANAFDASSTPAAESRSSSQRTMGLVLGAAGVVGVGVGSFFGLKAFSKNGDAEKECPNAAACPTLTGPSLVEDARNAATGSTIAFGLGLAALAGGAVLYFTAPSSNSAAQTNSLHARVGPGSIVLGGTFR
jgi:serine/threonine-protein kinase